MLTQIINYNKIIIVRKLLYATNTYRYVVSLKKEYFLSNILCIYTYVIHG